MRGRFARFIFAMGGAALAPLFASAHGTEFLLGKLTLSPGEVRLELTADCDGNPMIADRKEAAAILPAALQMRTGGEARSLEAYAPVRLEKRTKFDESAPMPPGTFDNTIDHQLLTAVWQWKAGEGPVQFTVPKASKHDVLLWMVDEANPGAETRWMVMLGGDVTPPITLTQPKPPVLLAINRQTATSTVAVGVITLFGIVLYRRRARPASRTEAAAP